MSKAQRRPIGELEKDIIFHIFLKHGHVGECTVCDWLAKRLKQLQEQRLDFRVKIMEPEDECDK